MPERQAPGEQLRVHGLRPRKRLGQNFLRDRSYLARVVAAAGIKPGDLVLEIGAGTGILTRALLEQEAKVFAIELDDALYELLKSELTGSNVQIRHGNALDFDPCEHFSEPYKLVANIPYYITGALLRHFLETACPPELMLLMVQREVAERMVAAPGKLSLLGVSVQFYAEARIVMVVPAGAFYPPPKVNSAVVLLRPHPSSPERNEIRKEFFELARAGFGTRRKQLANSLSHTLGVPRETVVELLRAVAIEPTRRAEALSVEDWERLARAWRERKNGTDLAKA